MFAGQSCALVEQLLQLGRGSTAFGRRAEKTGGGSWGYAGSAWSHTTDVKRLDWSRMGSELSEEDVL